LAAIRKYYDLHALEASMAVIRHYGMIATAVLGFAFSGYGVSPVYSQTTPSAGCFLSPAKLGDGDVARFVAAPTSLLSEYSQGGLPMSSRVRALAGSSADTLAPILGLVPSANDPQIAAIGSGLARAAAACASADLPYATRIQEEVALLGNAALETAFLAGADEIQTAAIGGAGGAAGGGVGGIGGGGVAGGGSAGIGGDASVSAGNSSFSASGSGRFFSSSVSAGNSRESVVSPN
jgi:hypothetical protein